MTVLIRACFAFWYGTILTYRFANVKEDRKTVLKMCVFFVVSILLQVWTDTLGNGITAERLYPFTTHIPLILWLIFLHKVSWEISIGSVITAYLCCELPNWVSQFGAIPFGSSYTVQVIIYCISSVVILLLLSRYLVPSIQALFAKSRLHCLSFTAIPFLYYLWCYSTTVYSSYLKQHGYEVAFTMSALFTLLFLIFAVSQNKHQEDVAVMKDLELSKQEAIRANRTKGDFLASMSHEIRTPINAVLGIDEMILRECNDPQILDYATKIKSSGQSLLYLINDILDLSKIDSNKMEITPSEYNPKQLISEVLLMIEPRADAKGLALHCDIDPCIPAKLYGDDMRLRQILINLLTNAVKYTNEGKVTFSVRLLQKNETEALLYFSVRDTGIGIKDEDRKLLFESFRRLDTSQNKGIEGTGLGLNITRKLLQLMGSDLCLQSIYEIGSDFHFELRQTIVDPQEMGTFRKGFYLSDATDTYREGFYAPHAKILVVDDNDINLIVFRGLLKNSGMDIRTALSGQEALDLLQTESFDMVFMDHLMPAMDGIEALHRILGNEQLHKNAKVIIALTANAISGAREFYLQEGFAGYLTKPVHGPELEKTFWEFLPPELIHPSTPEAAITPPSEQPEAPDVLPSQLPQMSEAPTSVTINSTRADEDTLDQKLGLRLCAGDKTIYREVLKAFVQSDFTASLNNYLAEQDWNGYRIAIHGTKSGAKSIGATALSALALDMETALSERNDTAYIQRQHPVALSEIAKLETLINEIVKY